MKLGLHIGDFTWAGGVSELGGRLADTVRYAEASGISRITVMDHYWQLGGDFGPAENPMLEAYTTLGFLAAHTERMLLHTLVTGVVYHRPGILAKQISTLDVLSGGRVGLGIGAAWYEAEARGLGIPFPPVAKRFECLEETLQVCIRMWSGEGGAFEGDHYSLENMLNSPRGLSEPRPYLMVGGMGERKTLRLVAEYADACNLFGGPEVPHKLEVLKRHCEDVGRPYEAVEKTATISIDPGTGRGDLVKRLLELRGMGITVVYLFGQGFTDPRVAVDGVAAALPEVADA